jgi:dGTP triphosphohydrolase
MVVVERRHSTEKIARLFDYLLDHPEALPEGYAEDPQPAYRTVCDYIAGMTDGYLQRVCDQLLG